MHYICLFYFIYLHRKYFHTYTCFQYFFQLNILSFTVSFPPNPCRVRISFHVYCTQFLYIWSCQTHKYNNYSRVTNILLSQILRFNHVLSHTHTISMPSHTSANIIYGQYSLFSAQFSDILLYFLDPAQ